jgi:hypothetical protein
VPILLTIEEIIGLGSGFAYWGYWEFAKRMLFFIRMKNTGILKISWPRGWSKITTSASRSRHLAEARAMAALIGMDQCNYLLSNFAQYFKRDVPTMSKRVKAMRTRLTKNRLMREKMGHINNQITTIRKA